MSIICKWLFNPFNVLVFLIRVTDTDVYLFNWLCQQVTLSNCLSKIFLLSYSEKQETVHKLLSSFFKEEKTKREFKTASDIFFLCDCVCVTTYPVLFYSKQWGCSAHGRDAEGFCTRYYNCPKFCVKYLTYWSSTK